MVRIRKKLLDLADFASQFFDDLFGCGWFHLQSVKGLGRSKFQFDFFLQPFDGTVFCTFRDLNELFQIKDFFGHGFSLDKL